MGISRADHTWYATCDLCRRPCTVIAAYGSERELCGVLSRAGWRWENAALGMVPGAVICPACIGKLLAEELKCRVGWDDDEYAEILNRGLEFLKGEGDGD